MSEIVTDYGMTYCSATYPINNSFTDLYIKDFYLANLPGPFEYSYSENAGEKTLLITNNLGNKALYKNWTLNVNKYKNITFSLSPNPVENYLSIIGDRISEINTIRVFNYLGQQLFSTDSTEIDVSSLKPGVYLVKIALDNGQFSVEKILKK